MLDADSILPNIHIRSYQPFSISFPAPGFYPDRIRLILPDVEPSVLGRLAGGISGGNVEPLCALVDFGRPVNAKFLFGFLKANLQLLEDISNSVSMPVHRSLWRKLQINGHRGSGHSRKLIGAENPLDALEALQYAYSKDFLDRTRKQDP